MRWRTSSLCCSRSLDIDAIEVIDACATKYNFMPHYPGMGVGGPCLPSNPYYLISEGVRVGNIPYMIRLAREINDRMPDHVVELVMEGLNGVGKTVNGSKIAVLGVAYKPDVKDIQLSPVERLARRLTEMGAHIAIYDPYFVGEEVFGARGETSPEEAVEDSSCIVIGTGHKAFKELDLERLATIAKMPAALVDARNVVDPRRTTEAGFRYMGVGRSSRVAAKDPSDDRRGVEQALEKRID